MARRYFRTPARKDSVLGLPRGPLYWVLKEYHESLDLAVRGPDLIASARKGSGLYVRPGVGCDATVVLDTAIRLPHSIREGSMCGEKPSSWALYRLREGGVTIGVRSCAEHQALLLEETSWSKELGRYEDFAVYEVMSG